jgi:hypothetical protein
VELVEGAEASVSPKVATTVVTEVGRGRQATAVAIQIARGIEEERGERVGAGLGRLIDPDTSRVSLAEPQWAGWASWPVGPNRLWPIVLKQNFKFKFKCYFLFEFKPNSKIQITLIKHFLIL